MTAASKKTVLTIMSDPARVQMYDHLARYAGANTLHADGALHALTQLERSPTDVVICEAQMDDMSGEEFRMVVQEEAKTSLVPVFILPDPEQLSGQLDLGVPALCGPEVLRQALQVIGLSPERFAPPMNTEHKPQLQGDLDQFALPDFLNWVSEMQFHGHWLVTVADAANHERTAHLLMERGNVSYAEFAGHTGKAAMFSLLRTIHQQPRTAFQFFKTEEHLNLVSEDLRKSTARLLMELAVDMDHLSVQHGPQH